MFSTSPKTHEAAFFTKNDKKMIMKKDKNTLPPLKSVSILGGGRGLIITQRLLNCTCKNLKSVSCQLHNQNTLVAQTIFRQVLVISLPHILLCNFIYDFTKVLVLQNKKNTYETYIEYFSHTSHSLPVDIVYKPSTIYCFATFPLIL